MRTNLNVTFGPGHPDFPSGERTDLANIRARRPGNSADTHHPPLAVSVEEAAGLLSIGRTSMFKLLKDGDLPSFQIGRRRLIDRKSIEAYVSKQLEIADTDR